MTNRSRSFNFQLGGGQNCSDHYGQRLYDKWLMITRRSSLILEQLLTCLFREFVCNIWKLWEPWVSLKTQPYNHFAGFKGCILRLEVENKKVTITIMIPTHDFEHDDSDVVINND